MRKPDFERNLLRVLRKEKPDRATLFELFLNDDYYQRLAGRTPPDNSPLEMLKLRVDAFTAAGYDYTTTHASSFHFRSNARAHGKTVSLNDGATITDWKSYEAYPWEDPGTYDTSVLLQIAPYLPEGMKLMVMGPGGVLENIISLTGYDNLCLMLYDDPALVEAIATQVGQALCRYYEAIAGYDTVGFLCSNDDWGFNTQTMLAPEQMRQYIFPWHQRIVSIAHHHAKPCILHSCGYFAEVIEDVINVMGYDGRHSYEDTILPVEQAYEQLVGRIAVMGGMDVDFMVRGTPEAIYDRSASMLQRTLERGGYCLGTGNSVPTYIPYDHYLAMIRAAHEFNA